MVALKPSSFVVNLSKNVEIFKLDFLIPILPLDAFRCENQKYSSAIPFLIYFCKYLNETSIKKNVYKVIFLPPAKKYFIHTNVT